MLELKKENSFDSCVRLAFNSFINNFDHKIKQLIHNFPENSTNENGTPFWAGSKRFPHNEDFNPTNDLHISFIYSYARILADALSININNNIDIKYIRDLASTFKIPAFIPKKVFIKTKDTDTDDTNEELIEEDLKRLMKELSIIEKKEYNLTEFKPVEFEKDNDKNFHIEFMYSASNLRANNYKIDGVR